MPKNKEHPETWKFRKAYANIPIALRSSEICCVVDNEPMTFNVVKLEVDNNTKIGYKAIEQMSRLKII